MPEVRPDILHLEACNFIDRPVGGQLTFSRQLMQALSKRLALAGWAAPGEPVGHWFQKEIDGVVYPYFAFGRDGGGGRKPLVPARFTTLLQVRRHLARIFAIGIPNVIVQEHSIMMALGDMSDHNLCYCFPGVASPLTISRYRFAGLLAATFDHFFFRAVGRHATCLLAAADEAAVADLKQRGGERLLGKRVVSFPTRVDTAVFHPAESGPLREKLGLSTEAIIAVTTGRVHWAKGWSLLLESFQLFHERCPEARLVFVGDGPDREALLLRTSELGLAGKVATTGYQTPPEVAEYLQVSDLYVMGSLQEGWSTALVEALACHLPIVTTRVSSADTIVRQAVNGFVLEGRDPAAFADAMEAALCLPSVAQYAAKEVERYALNTLQRDFFNVWSLT